MAVVACADGGQANGQPVSKFFLSRLLQDLVVIVGFYSPAFAYPPISGAPVPLLVPGDAPYVVGRPGHEIILRQVLNAPQLSVGRRPLQYKEPRSWPHVRWPSTSVARSPT
jgi:hypothetical protein